MNQPMSPALPKTIIRCTLKLGRATVPGWIKGVAWRDGTKVKSVTYTQNQNEAARFSTATAFDVAVQYYTSPMALYLADGTLLEKDTIRLQHEQATKLAAARANRIEYNNAMRTLFNEMPVKLRQSIESVLSMKGLR